MLEPIIDRITSRRLHFTECGVPLRPPVGGSMIGISRPGTCFKVTDGVARAAGLFSVVLEVVDRRSQTAKQGRFWLQSAPSGRFGCPWGRAKSQSVSCSIENTCKDGSRRTKSFGSTGSKVLSQARRRQKVSERGCCC